MPQWRKRKTPYAAAFVNSGGRRLRARGRTEDSAEPAGEQRRSGRRRSSERRGYGERGSGSSDSWGSQAAGGATAGEGGRLVGAAWARAGPGRRRRRRRHHRER